MEQFDDLLAAADVELGEDILDTIDHVVQPGTDIAGTAHFTGNPSLRPQARRRGQRPEREPGQPRT
jgi:aryl-alcohol dehydrogenase (NADP+)